MKFKQLFSRKPTVQNGFESAELFQSPKSFHMVPSQILYVDYTDNEDAKRFISQNLDALYAKFKAKGYTFVSLKDEISLLTGTNKYTMQEVIRYCYPDIRRFDYRYFDSDTFKLPTVSKMASITDKYLSDVKDGLLSVDYKEVAKPGLLRLVDYSVSSGVYIFEYKSFCPYDNRLWKSGIDDYIKELPELSDEADFSLPQTPEGTPEEPPQEETASAIHLYEFTETLHETMGDDFCLRDIIPPEEEADVSASSIAPPPPLPPETIKLPEEETDVNASIIASPSPPSPRLRCSTPSRADIFFKRAKIPKQIPLGKDELAFLDAEPKPKHELFNKMSALINEARQLGIYEELIRLFYEQHNPHPETISPLLIDADIRIRLPKYDLEIDMTPLQKALYILFLLHPEGIRNNKLPDYEKELRDIYHLISKSVNIVRMNASIHRLCDPSDGSVREKMSQIRKAFVSTIPDRYASHYYISGERGEVRYIRIANRPDFFDLPPIFRGSPNIPLTR